MDLLFKVKSEEETEQVLKSKNASLLTENDSFLENYVHQSRPLLLKSGCSEVASKWTTDYLQKTTQDGLEVDIDIAPPSSNGLFADIKSEREKLGIEEKTVPFTSVLDGSCKPSPNHYLYLQQQSWPFDVVFPVLSKDLKTASCPLIQTLSQYSLAKILWLGGSPTRSQLHFDRKDNFICQMCGQKEILLFAPEETENLYQKDKCDENDLFNNRFSSINTNLSPEKFKENYPKTSQTIATRVILNPGDVLFVPKLWWHLVSSFPDADRKINIMVNMFFEKPQEDASKNDR